MTTVPDCDEGFRCEVRREILREVFEALSPDAPWKTDDRFEHYPLDVQAIAQLTADQCAEQVKRKGSELARKLKLQHEKEVKAITQRCLKDKQASKIEAEADKKTMGLEMARVKKRLIEAEREKHQVSCQTAQAQRDARNLRNQVKEMETKAHEVASAAKRKSDSLLEMEKHQAKCKKDMEQEMQRMKEEILNLEARLNNQAAEWNEKCDVLIKTAQEDKEKSVYQLRVDVKEECKSKVNEALLHLVRQIQSVSRQQMESTRSLIEMKEQLKHGYSRTSGIQLLFRDGAMKEVEFLRKAFAEVVLDLQSVSRHKKQLKAELNHIQKLLEENEVSSIQELTEQLHKMKDSLEGEREERRIQGCEINNLRTKLATSTEEKQGLNQRISEIEKEACCLQRQLENIKTDLTECQKEKEITQDRFLTTEIEKAEIASKLDSLAHDLDGAHRFQTSLQEEKQRLESDMISLRRKHSEELQTVREEDRKELLSLLLQVKCRFFDVSSSVLDGLSQAMADATTQSCIRALKLNSQLRASCVQSRRASSAIQSIVTRVKTDMDALVTSTDLETTLEQLKQMESTKQSSSERESTANPEIRDINGIVKEMECCIFWLLLDARIMRDKSFESLPLRSESHSGAFRVCEGPTSSYDHLRTGKRASERRRPKSGQKTETKYLERQPTKPKEDPHSKMSESEEIVEIIAVLKEYLRNGKYETPL